MLTTKPSSLPSITPAGDRLGTIPKEQIPRSSFNRSCSIKTTLPGGGMLVPIYWDEVLPGDVHNVKCTTLARLSTPLVPIMDNIWAETFFFFVPNRLLWDNWEKFCGAQTNPGDSTAFTIPQVTIPSIGVQSGELMDYLGVPTGIPSSTSPWTVSALPLRAYNRIWNAWFRDENLQNSLDEETDNGPDAYAQYATPQRRGRRPNYFTSCLPFPQKGTALNIPMAATSVVHAPGTTGVIRNAAGAFVNGVTGFTTSGTGAWLYSPAAAGASYDPNGSLAAIGGTINELRQAEQLQVLLERDARGGTRYTESIRQHFGVISDDARLQRPEYLGGGRQNMNITPIPQTSVTGATPQGNLAATGSFGGPNGGFVKSFTEHGIIIGMIAVSADQSYQNGLDRGWSRLTRYDHFWPALQNLGEQPVPMKEINLTDTTAKDTTFGYLPRYEEYKQKNSIIAGLLRSNAAGSLDIWHLAMDYSAGVALNAAFIVDNPPLTRIMAVPSEPPVILDAYFNVTSARPMQTFAVPGGRL